MGPGVGAPSRTLPGTGAGGTTLLTLPAGGLWGRGEGRHVVQWCRCLDGGTAVRGEGFAKVWGSYLRSADRLRFPTAEWLTLECWWLMLEVLGVLKGK